MRPERISSGVAAEAARPATATDGAVVDYMRVGQVAGMFKVTTKTVGRWAEDGKLPFRRTLGGHRRYPSQAIRELAASLQGPAA
jgi:excisionase family DNA binding protein